MRDRGGSQANNFTLVSVLSLPASGYAQAVLNLGPTAYWPLHETAPPAQGDIETNLGTLGALGNAYFADWNRNAGFPNNDLPDRMAIYHQVPGALTDGDTAAYFDTQTGAYAVIPHTSPAATLLPPFTLEAWVEPYNDNGYGIIIGNGGNSGFNGSANRGGFRWLWAGSANTFSMTVFNGNGSGSTEPKTSAIYYPGNWYHLVTTFDGSTVTYYINGVQAAQGAATMAVDSFSPLTIGGGNWNGNINNLFNGAIDEVAIYTNLLDPSRITAHYTAGTAANPNPTYKNSVLADSPLIYLRMNSPTWSVPPRSTWPVLTNYGTAALNGGYYPGSVPGNVAGPSENGIPVANLGGTNAFGCNGLSQFAVAGLRPEFNPTGKTPLSVSAWFRGNPSDNRFQAMFGHTDSSWRFAMHGGSGKAQFNPGIGSDATSARIYNDGNWHHMVGVYDGGTTVGSSNTYLYVDGVLDTKLTGITGNGIPGSSLPPMLAADPQYTNNAAGPGRQFAGSLCEAAFWNGVALSSNQVQALYTAAGVAPFIGTQPVSATANQNSALTNTVVAFGSSPLAYQWYKNNLRMPVGGQLNLPVGATNASLILNPVLPTDASTNYYVVVTNNYGRATSAVVSLSVFTVPVFVSEPINVTLTNNIILFAGAHPTFKVATIGAQPITNQWFTNGIAATSAAVANTNYSLPPLQLNGVTNFYCVAANFLGRTTNTPVSVIALPDSASPFPQAVFAANPIGYWRLNEPEQGGGDPGVIADDYWGANNGIYTNTALGQPGYNAATDPLTTSAQFGFSTVSDSDAYGMLGIDFTSPTNTSKAFSVEAWVKAGPQSKDAAIVTKEDYGGSNPHGEQFDLDTGGANHAFRFFVRDGTSAGAAHGASSTIVPDNGWHHLVGICDEPNGFVYLYVDGGLAAAGIITPGSGINSSTNPMTIGARNSSPSVIGNDLQFVGYINDVAIYNRALSASEVGAHYFAAGIPPFITQEPPANADVNENGTVSIPAAATGTVPLSYQWYNQNTGLPVANATNATLVLSNVSFTLNGVNFYLTITNFYGMTNTSMTTLTVNQGAPQIVRDLPPQVVAVAGSSYTYAPLVTGTEPLHFQWYNGVSPIVGQNSSTYAFAAAAGNYSFTVTNSFSPPGATSIVSVLTVVPARTDPYSTALLGYGAIGYWPLNETNPPPVADIETNLGSFGSAGNAFYESSAQVQKQQPGALAGDPDTAITLNGTSGSWLGVPRRDPRLTISNAFTVECWVKPNDENFAALVSQATPIGSQTVGYRGDPNVNGWALYQNGGSAGNFSFHLYNGVTGGGVEPKESAVYSTVSWNHVVAVFDGSVETLYVNGLQSVTAQSLSSVSPSVYSPNYYCPIQIGGSGINHNVLNGSIDEVAIYTNALSASRIEAHFEAGTNAAVTDYKAVVMADNPYLYWRLNSPTYTAPSTNAYPQAVNYGSLGPVANGFYQPGTLPGMAGPGTFGFGNNNFATAFNGLNSCVDIPYNGALDPVAHKPFSISAWFKGNPADGAGRWENIFGHSDMSWVFHLNNTVPNFDVGFNGGNSDVNIATNLVNANDGNWHFCAGTYDGFIYTIYVDTFSASAAASGTGVPGTNLDILIGGDPQFVEFGNNGGFNERYWPGNIAQLSFFTNALTSAQVNSIYTLGTNNAIRLIVTHSGNDLVVTWNAGALLSSTNVAGPYLPVANATSPYTFTPNEKQRFFRASFPP